MTYSVSFAAREAVLFDKKGSRKYLNAAERNAYFKVVMDDSNPAQRAFCLTLFYTGCRISEALNLTMERIDLTAKTIVFETLKQRKAGHFRSVPVPDTLVGLLRAILDGKAHEAKIWKFSRTTAFRRVKIGMIRAEVQGGMACPKGLRHGFAIACVYKKIPLTTIQKWLGHARIETTAIYLEVSGTEERELAERLRARSGTVPPLAKSQTVAADMDA